MLRLLLSLALIGAISGAVMKGKRDKDRGRNEPHCGLPIFTENLPEPEKTRVYNIWERYEDGDDCESERADTKRVLESLTPEVRRRALAPRGPAFLRGASPDVRRQFEELWRDKTVPRAEKPEKFKELAKRLLNPIQMKEFDTFHESMEKRRAEFRRKLSTLSPEARAAHEKMNELREQRNKIYTDLSDSARQELQQLYRHEKYDRHD